jgi:hypothetical protein
MNQPVVPNAEEVVLYAHSRDEAYTTLECYVGAALAGDISGRLIYSILYKPFGSPSWTSIYSFQGGSGQYTDGNPFIIEKYWIYTHKHNSIESAQYYVSISNTEEFLEYPSNTISVPKFRGFGSKTTRSSGNGPLKSSRKTRNETPRF